MTGARLPGRDRDALAADLIGILGLGAVALGLGILRTSDQVGFDVGRALDGIVSQLGLTLPADGLVLGAMILELAAGLVVARLARREAFDSLAEAALAAAVATVLKGVFLVGLLGTFGLFRGPILAAIDVAILAAARWAPRPLGRQPVLAVGVWRTRARRLPSLPLVALVAIAWAGPILLQLASPVVPFIDVLPNHVGPVEHLRTFGTLSPLTATQSPIYGPSRFALGYEGWLGSVAAITNLPAGLAASAFVLPTTVLVALGVQRLASAVAGPGRAVGPWALLAFAVTEPFARLADARGTVVVLPLACLALALAVERLRADGQRVGSAWRGSVGPPIGLALGAAILVHPVIGAFAVATVAILALAQPDRLAGDAAVAVLTAGVLAVIQLAVMVGVAVPPLVLVAGLPAAALVGAAAARIVRGGAAIEAALVGLARWARLGLVVVLLLGLAASAAAGVAVPGRLPDAAAAGWTLLVDSCGVLLLALVLGWLLGVPAAASPLVLATTGVGLVAVVATQLLPDDLGFLGDALRFEVPKTVHYWLPVFVAIAAGVVLAGAWEPSRVPWPARAAAVAAIVALAALPIRGEAIDAYHLGEHRLSEALAIDLRWAGNGYWAGFPDARQVVDPPRREILDAIRAEIDAGRIRHDTAVLHVARSFQEWVSTPLGVFDGVLETFVSPDREVSQQTAGGRLFGMASLDGFIASGAYPYVVLEPAGLPEAPAIRDELLAAGYRAIFANDQGAVFARG